jgi:hypothetical protein
LLLLPFWRIWLHYGIKIPAEMLSGDGIMGALFAFPLLFVSLAVYNIMAFTAPASLGQPAFEPAMLSSVVLEVSWGDLVILSGLLLLTIEVMKAARVATPPVVHNVLASLVFLVALAELVLVEQAATATFFILVVICLINVIAGLAIATRPGHRTLSARPA